MLNRLFAAIRGQNDDTTVDDAAALVERARGEHAEAAQALDAAQIAYRASLTAVDDKVAIGARAELDRRQVLLDRAAAAIELAEAGYAEAEARAEVAGRRQRYQDAQAKIDVAVKALRTYRSHAVAIREIMRLAAEADNAMVAANADLPEGAPPLLSADRIARGIPGEPEKILSRERKPDQWAYAMPGSADYEEGRVDYGYGHLGAIQKTVLQPSGIEVTFVPEVPALVPDPLAASLLLPGFGPGEGFIFTPTGGTDITRSPGPDATAVLETIAKLEAAERQKPEDPRIRHMARTRIEPVPPGSPPMPPKADTQEGRLGERIMWQGPGGHRLGH